MDVQSQWHRTVLVVIDLIDRFLKVKHGRKVKGGIENDFAKLSSLFWCSILHTGRFGSNFSHFLKFINKFELSYEDRSRVIEGAI